MLLSTREGVFPPNSAGIHHVTGKDQCLHLPRKLPAISMPTAGSRFSHVQALSKGPVSVRAQETGHTGTRMWAQGEQQRQDKSAELAAAEPLSPQT